MPETLANQMLLLSSLLSLVSSQRQVQSSEPVLYAFEKSVCPPVISLSAVVLGEGHWGLVHCGFILTIYAQTVPVNPVP